MTREFHVVLEAERADVGHDVISAVRSKGSKTCALQFRQQQVPPGLIVHLQSLVVRRWQRQCICARSLQRRGGADGKKVMDRTAQERDSRWRNAIAIPAFSH